MGLQPKPTQAVAVNKISLYDCGKYKQQANGLRK